MLRVLILLCLLVAVPVSRAATLGARLETVRIAGRPYNRLGEWAGPNGFSLSWQSKDKVVVASGKGHRLRFEIDSRKADIDGVSVTLAFPVALRSGEAHLAPLDIEKNVLPLVYPSRDDGASPIRTICLDPGHGGKDPGNMEGKRMEKDYVLLLAHELSRQLRDAGYRVFSTRSQDAFVELDDRPAFANKHKADLFISLHFNSAGAPSASGVEVFCLTPAGAASSYSQLDRGGGGWLPGNRQDSENVLLAHSVAKSLVKATGAGDRGVLRARFAVLKTVKMPAVLVEGGFMTNPEEGPQIYQSDYRKKIASGIVAGVDAYKKKLER
jgi:N-acetylmuramoyl-L-alanine amidase